ncbi:tyrosine-type recombinase/integrase [Pseudoalteromonas sp. MMG024]|uniref:tyrosine-type recombinase/integrase n=1 Tax=Pseudoalteromonas sp. MMG024 TaxID=2909980 RepID=UPI001EFF6F01|nr:tyrosine-type recombinase/integrase [Pseudoalteromonas sp. MMG024]MCF6459172.1 tyrosine-type recombinase/integrase [Pseudoalteromonas sp. MMG024]
MSSKVQLTKKYIESINIEEKKQLEIIDLSEPVLRVIAYANTKSFVARVCWKNQRYCETLGTYPYLPIPKARQLAAQFKLDIQTQNYRKKDSLTLREFINKHYKNWVVVENKTGREYIRRLENIILPALGNKQVGHIGRLDISSFLEKRSMTVKPATVNRDQSLLSSVFSLAVELGFVHESDHPVKGLKKRAENNVNKKNLPSDEQVKSLMNICKNNQGEHLGYSLVLLLIYTGLRVSEALALKKSDIAKDLSSFWVRYNKSDRPIQLPINSEAKKVFEYLINSTWNDYLFPSPVRPNSAMVAPRALLKNMAIKAGISEFGYHYCRAIFCSIVAKQNVHIASKLLNHSDLKVTSRYIYHSDDVMKSASELVVEHFK